MRHSLLIASIVFFSICLSSPLFSGNALSQSETAHPTLPVAVPVDQYSGIVGCDVNGYVLDTNGDPVTNAYVTLRHKGQASNSSDDILDSSQMSSINSYNYGGDGGYFHFVVNSKGPYTITAEKDGFNSSANVEVKSIIIGNSVFQNVTLKGYYVPTLSREQLAYIGAISGVVLDNNGVILPGVNVTLWQDGRLVRIPNNPQYASGGKESDEFLFEHLAPGHYELLADNRNQLGDVEGTVAEVDESKVIANITMQNYTYFTRGPPIPSNTPKPSPYTDSLLAVLSICAAALVFTGKAKP